MATKRMSPELLEMVAERFKALSDRARLSLLQELRGGSRTVNELVDVTGMGQANVSRHLSQLFANGLVARERDGVFVRYQLADQDVLKLCELVCGRLESELTERRKVLGRR
ncbi:ArsR/SmtB family transcription factor [Gemmatimonas sp.]|uniref:ArsR/SmtB family transcription factor n=1 Tax=Gemmatimonas sp. TaxID=1962908 RepID=UPI0031C209F3|nr:winged helix-turn-helix transcriptional regulator [Gemmatimonas sp.]